MMWGPPDLATVALVQMNLDVGVHSGPVEARGNTFSGFGDSVMSGEHGPMGIS